MRKIKPLYLKIFKLMRKYFSVDPKRKKYVYIIYEWIYFIENNKVVIINRLSLTIN